MGAILQGNFYSTDGTKYRVTLDVDGYSDTISDFDISEMKLIYKGDTNDIHTPILTSSVRITFSIPDATIKSVFTGLVGAAEESYRLKIEKGVSNDLFWCGFIIPDQVVIQDKPYPYAFSVEAVDGITRLKEKDYTGTGTEWEDDATFLQHIFNCLSFIPVDDFWFGSDVYLRARNQLFATGQTSGEAVSPLPNTRVNHRVFRKVDSGGAIEYDSAYDVLKTICVAMASRLYISNGSYYFEQITEYANQDSTITIKTFDKSAGALTDETLDDWDSRKLIVDRSSVRLSAGADLTVASGTINTYLSALSEVKVRYEHYSYRDVFAQASQASWTNVSNPSVSVGDVDDESGTASLVLSTENIYSIDFDTSGNAQAGRLKFRCLISIDDGTDTYYCTRTASYDFGVVSYQDATWSTSTGYVEFYTDSAYLNDNSFLGEFNFRTPVFPVSGEMVVDFDFVELQGLSSVIANSGGTAYTATWEIDNPYGEIFTEGTTGSGAYLNFVSTNDNDTNSDKLSFSVKIGDGPTATSFGRLQIYTGSQWNHAASWKKQGGSTFVPHSARIAQEIITPRLEPTERIEGTLIDSFMAHEVIERSETRYMFMAGTIDLHRNRVDGTWCFITDVATLATTPDTGVDIGDPVTPGVPPPYTPQGPIGWPGGTITPSGQRINLDSNVVYTTTGLVSSGDTVTFLTVDEREIIHPFFNGDPIRVVHPYTGVSQGFEVSETEESDKTISVTSDTADFDFPLDSFVTPDINFFFRLLTKLRRIHETIQLIPYYLDIPIDSPPTQFDAFWRVPQDYDGYRMAKLTVSIHTPGTGAVEFVIRVTKTGGIYQDITQSFTGSQTQVTLSTYWLLTAGEIVEFFLQSTTATSETQPKGLTIGLQIIATL